MLKDISTIQVQGANFSSLSSLALFDPIDGNDKNGNAIIKTIKGSLVYGRNGAGKSTIAKVFRKEKGEEISMGLQSSLLDKDSSSIVISEDEKKRVFVFDEDYVNTQVKLKQDHLETIVMLGAAVDLAEKIEKKEKERDVAKEDYEIKSSAYQEFKDINNPKSPLNKLRKIGDALRGDDAWAGRDRCINGGKQNSQVRDDTYKKFVNLEPPQTRSELIVEFDKLTKALEVAKAGTSRIEKPVPEIPVSYINYDEGKIKDLLEEIIQKPELSEREQYLLSLVKSGKAEELASKASYFRKTSVNKCPYCFQDVLEEYKSNLVASIEKVLSKVVSEHQRALKECEYDDIIIDLSLYKEFENYQKCIDLIEKINAIIQRNNELIRRKIDNPYDPEKLTDLNFATYINELNVAFQELELERLEYNKKVSDPRLIIKRLNEINSYIAKYDISNFVAEYEKQCDESRKAEETALKAKTEYEIKKSVVEELEAQRKNVHHALEVINACLKYIFFAEDRLKIDYVDGEYRLYSKGKSVRPCDVSVGERNIIALSYFFTSIMEGQDEKTVYDKEYLLVIDDPVSSFDTENCIGILSFLKYKLSLFLEGNENTKALVMTHDLKTFYDIHKVFEEIVDSCKKKGYKYSPKFNRYELVDCGIIPFKYSSRQEYTEILKTIFAYGSGSTSEQDLIIGNIMRQALEAFATFQYKKGIEGISTDDVILNLLPEPEYQAYYKNLMYRLVLHGGSHKEEQIKAMKDFEFFSLISKPEKQRTAKEVICFIYLLNKPHVLQHLKEVNNAETTLETWCNEVKARAAMP